MPRKPGETHKYREIADGLRRRIAAGDFEVTRKLPGERGLRDHYGVSLMTVRQALGVLRDEGLIESRQGAGWYLAEWKPIVRRALKRLYPDQWEGVPSMWDVDVEGREWAVIEPQVDFPRVSADVARVLGLAPDSNAWRRDRKYAVDAVPVMRATSYIPDEFARGTRITEVDTGDGGIYARLSEAGHGPVEFVEQFRSRLATPVEADDLGLAVGAPVIEQHRLAMQDDGRVVEFNRMILDASRFLLVYDVKR